MNIYAMTKEQRNEYRKSCALHDNIQAIAELNDFEKFFNERVKVVKGRKVPIGTEGKVFFVKRMHFGTNQWTGWETRLGLLLDNDSKVYINSENVQII